MAPASLLARARALRLDEVGRSREARPIHAGCLGKGQGSPLLVLGGVHGDEPAGVEAVLDLFAALSAGSPDREVWFLPVVNPDGLHAGHKDNAAGVDLNRNLPARNFTREHPEGYFPGAAPASEPENAVLVSLVEDVRPVAVLSVHAPLACVNYDGPAAAWAAQVAAACGWPAREDIGYPTPGSLGSWLGRDAGLPVLTLELPAGAYRDFADRALSALRTAIATAPC